MKTLSLISLMLTISLSPSASYVRSTASVSSDEGTRIVMNADTGFLAIGQGSAWVWDRNDRVIEAIDLETATPTDTSIPLDFEPFIGSAGVEMGSLWVLSDNRAQLARIDLTTYEVIAAIDLSAYYAKWEYVSVVTGEGTVWIRGEETVTQIDPRTNQVIGEPIPSGEEVIIATVARGELWTGSHDDGLITRIDAQTNQTTDQLIMDFSVHGLAVTGDAAWVLDEHGFAVVRVDPTTNTVTASIPIDFVASNIMAAGDDIWVAPAAQDNGPTGNDVFVRIDSETNTIVEEVHVGVTESRRDGYYLGLYEDGEAWALIYDDERTTLVRLSE
jgi:streptogramin lyase